MSTIRAEITCGANTSVQQAEDMAAFDIYDLDFSKAPCVEKCLWGCQSKFGGPSVNEEQLLHGRACNRVVCNFRICGPIIIYLERDKCW